MNGAARKRTGREYTVGLKYHTGEEIQLGDRVRYGGEAGVIEFVVEALTGAHEEAWFFETHGEGVMVAEPKVFGRVYLPKPHEQTDLQFIGRAGKAPVP